MHKSKKIILLFVLTMVIFFQTIVFAETIATPTSAKVVVNSKLTYFEAYSIEGSNYFKLKDIAFVVNGSDKQFAVNWDGTNKVINLISDAPYSPVGSEMCVGDGKTKKAVLNTSKINKDGNPIELTAYTIGGYNFFKLADLAQAFNIGVTWDPLTKTVGIDTAKNYDENSNSEVLLTSIIETETYTYCGEVKDGKPNGQGKMIWKSGTIYVGEFLNGEYNGQGSLSIPNGDTYVGEFLNDDKNGQGTYTWSEGNSYAGEWLNGEYSGQGTYTWPSGTTYVGEWSNGAFNGQGTYTYFNGDKYVGEYLNGDFYGQGTYTRSDGSKYVGEFLNGTFNGQGAEYDNTGKKIREGYYWHGMFVR